MAGLAPLALTRHVSLLRRGTKTLLEALVENVPDATEVGLWGRAELASVTRDSTSRGYNEKAYAGALLVNARARPGDLLRGLASKQGEFTALSGGDLVAARLGSGAVPPGVITRRTAARLARRGGSASIPGEPLFAGYWDLVESNGLAIAEQARRFDEFLPLPRGVQARGPAANIMIQAGADVEEQVTIDARLGPVVVSKGAVIESFSRVMGPCYIGPRAKLYSALIGGGTSIFESCKVGGQVENSVVMPYSNKAHHGYVGDSYIGSWVNIGAGCTFSNLKSTYGTVRVSVGGTRVDSGRVKLGPAVGDMAKLSIGALVFAGKVVGAGSHVTGLADGDIPPFSYHRSGKKGVELKLESVLETQRRMMERRGLSLDRAEEGVIKKAFAATAAARHRAGFREGALA